MAALNGSWQHIFDKWRAAALGTEPINRKEAETAVGDLYEMVGWERPWVVHCRGPFELAIMPSLFIAVVRSQIWRTLSAEYRDKEFPGDNWAPYRRRLELAIINPTLQAIVETWQRNDHLLALLEPLKERLSDELYRRVRHEARSQDDHLSERLARGSGDRLTAPPSSRYGTLDRSLSNLASRLEATVIVLRRSDPQLEVTIAARSAELNNICAPLAACLSQTFQLLGGALDQQWQSTLSTTWSLAFAARYYAVQLSPDKMAWSDTKDSLRVWTDFALSMFACRHFEYLCFTSDRPLSLSFDERRRLHNDDGPAAAFRDGFEIFAKNGIAVPRHVIEDPAKITLAEIESEQNLERRRLLVDAYGPARYLEDSDAEVLDESEYGVLYYKPQGRREEPLVMVKVRNSTPEPDGTFKHYYLRVPPSMRSAKQAVAWTFGLQEDDYSPSRET